MAKDAEHIIADGKTAERLLADEVFQAACDAVDRKSTDEWKNSKIEDVKTRESAYYTTRALQRIRIELAVIAEDGKMADHKLKHEQAQREPLRAGRS